MKKYGWLFVIATLAELWIQQRRIDRCLEHGAGKVGACDTIEVRLGCSSPERVGGKESE